MKFSNGPIPLSESQGFNPEELSNKKQLTEFKLLLKLFLLLVFLLL